MITESKENIVVVKFSPDVVVPKTAWTLDNAQRDKFAYPGSKNVSVNVITPLSLDKPCTVSFKPNGYSAQRLELNGSKVTIAEVFANGKPQVKRVLGTEAWEFRPNIPPAGPFAAIALLLPAFYTEKQLLAYMESFDVLYSTVFIKGITR